MHTIKSASSKLVSRSVKFLGFSGTALLVASAAPLAVALPPGGAGEDTPGTYSSISPYEVEQCASLNFEVGGFPAGEIVNIKIDDGIGFAGDASVQGQGVIARQKIDSDGVASGSIEIPCDLPPGDHHLRYLATEGERNLGFTNRGGSDFVVVAPAGQSESESDSDSDSTTGGSGGGTNNSAGGGSNSQKSGNSRRVVKNRGNSGQAEEEIVEEIIYADEGGQSNGQQRSSSGSGKKDSAALDTAAAKPTLSGKSKSSDSKGKSSDSKSTSTATNDGIFDKSKDKKKKENEDTVLAAGPQGPNSTPYIGLFVGGAILLVGMTAINAWLLVQRKRY